LLPEHQHERHQPVLSLRAFQHFKVLCRTPALSCCVWCSWVQS
jgi:hypothetical protein